jgi:hypothetical protein
MHGKLTAFFCLPSMAAGVAKLFVIAVLYDFILTSYLLFELVGREIDLLHVSCMLLHTFLLAGREHSLPAGSAFLRAITWIYGVL